MEHIKHSILNYVKSNSQYALLVEGEWGVGKTYFITNKIFPLLKDDYEIIYISLYGSNNLKSIKAKIENEILGINKILDPIIEQSKEIDKYWIKEIGNLADVLLSYRNSKKILEHTNKIILFIDDLERLSDEVSINDCLGLINSDFMEKLMCKVVFIGNTNEIENGSKNEFYRMKEKIIDKTLLFNPSSKEIIDEIIKLEQSEFILNNKEFIIDNLSFFFETINIRTLQTIFLNFSYFEEIVENSDVDSKFTENINKSLFLNIMVLTNEYKKGLLRNNIFQNFNSNSKYLVPLSTEILEEIASTNQKNGTKVGEEKHKNDTITEKYHGKKKEFDDNIFYFNGIERYIMHGYYDRDLFEDAYQKWKNTFFPESDFSNYEEMYNFRDMSENEFFERQQKVITNISDKRYEFLDVVKIFKLFLDFKRLDILLIEEDLITEIEREIYNRCNVEAIEDFISYSHLLSEPEIKEIGTLRTNLKRLEREFVFKKSKKLLKSILENDREKIAEYDNPMYYKQIFNLIDEQIINEYLLIDNNKAHNLMRYIRRHSFNKEEIYGEVNRILTYLRNANKNDMGKLTKFKLKELIMALEECIE